MTRRRENILLAGALGALALAWLVYSVRGDCVVQFAQWPQTVGSGSAETMWTDPVAWTAYWDFDQLAPGSDFADSTGNGMVLTNSGGTQVETGTNENARINYAVSHNGVDSYCTRGPLADTTAYLVAFWLKWDGIGANEFPLANGLYDHGWYIQISAGGALSIVGDKTSQALNINAPSNAWVHIGVAHLTNSGTSAVSYGVTNGRLSSVKTSMGWDVATTAFRVANYAAGGYQMGGLVDEIAYLGDMIPEPSATSSNVNIGAISNLFYYTPPVTNFPGAYSGGNIRVRGTP